METEPLLTAAEARIERLEAAHRHIQGVAEQAEVFHPQIGASRTFARIAEAARAALAGKEGT